MAQVNTALYREFVDWMLSHKASPEMAICLSSKFFEEYAGDGE